MTRFSQHTLNLARPISRTLAMMVVTTATLAAIIMMSESAEATTLGVNLVTNGSFETKTGAGNNDQATDWLDNGAPASQTVSDLVVDWTDTRPAGSGNIYWRGGASNDSSIDGVAEATQDIALGLTVAQEGIVDGGNMLFDLSAYFTTYYDQPSAEEAQINLIFLDAGSSQVGSTLNLGGVAFYLANINGSSNANQPWVQDSTSGILPVGTRTVRIELENENKHSAPTDGNIDLVDFQVSGVPEPSGILLLGIAGLGMFSVRRKSLRS